MKKLDDGRYSQIVTADNQLVLWNRKHYNVPLMVPKKVEYTQETPDVRQRIWTALTQSLEQSELDVRQQQEFFCDWLNLQGEQFEATQATSEYEDYSSAVFRWRYLGHSTATFADLPIPAGGIDPAFRETVTYAVFEMQINHAQSQAATSALIPADKIPALSAFTAYVRVPTSVDATTNQEGMDAFITNLNYRDFAAYKTAATNLNDNLVVGEVLSSGSVDSDRLRKKVDNARAKVTFEFIKHQNRTNFIGSLTQKSLETRLRECVQKPGMSVDRYFSVFKSMLHEGNNDLNSDENYNFNAVELCLQGLSKDIRDNIIEQQKYTMPNAAQRGKARFQIRLVANLQKLAQKAEKDIKQIINIARPAEARPAKRAAHAMVADPILQSIYGAPPSQDHSIASIYGQTQEEESHYCDPQGEEDHAYTYEVDIQPSNFVPNYYAGTSGSPARKSLPPEDKNDIVEAAVLQAFSNANPEVLIKTEPEVVGLLAELSIAANLSPAEIAMRQASRMYRPSTCWGCGDLEKYKGSNIHHFNKCPHKNDPDVMRAGTAKIVEFCERMKNRFKERAAAEAATVTTPPPTDTTPPAHFTRQGSGTLKQLKNNWQEYGYPSKSIAELTANIANPATSSDKRSRLFAKLATELAKKQSTSTTIQSEDSTGQVFVCYPAIPMMIEIPLFSAIHNPAVWPIQVSNQLPHVRMPVGRKSDKKKQEAIMFLADSGAGLNLGHLEYFMVLHANFPHLVKDFKPWNECTSMEMLSIGGVSEAQKVHVSHIVKLHTPFEIKGRPVYIAVGLSNKVTTTAILGLPFFRSTKSQLDFKNDVLTIGVFGTSLKLEYHLPTVRDNPIRLEQEHEDTLQYVPGASN